jgi:acetylornithine/N-succinyldiaminopimelate aminotransferase
MSPVAQVAHAPTSELIRDAEASLMYVVTRPSQVMVRGKGCYLWDADDRKYLDFIGGWAVTSLGHCPPALVRAINNQAKTLINASPALYNEPMIRLAKLLTDNSCLDKVFFGSTGAEVNEGAVKLARKWGAKHKHGAFEVITTWNSFHGRTLAMMSATGKQHWDELFEPKVPGFKRVPFNDLKAMRQAITPQTCAIMVEPIQGEGGVWVGTKSYLQGLRQLCDEHNILLILDEVQTGVGRTGTLWAYEQYGIEPDVMTLAKGLGGGFPVAALLAKDKFCVFEAGDQGGTYCAQPLAMVAGHAVVSEVIRKKIATKAKNRGAYLRRRLKALEGEYGLSNVRGKGLLVAVDLPQENGPQVVQACFNAGLLINAPVPKSVRFMPPLTVSRAEVDEMLDIFTGVLRKLG